MIGPAQLRDLLARHLRRMRLAAILSAFTVVAGAVAVFHLPRRPLGGVSPLAVTAGTLAVSLWLAFTADGRSRTMLARIRKAFEEHGDTARLLRDHFRVYLVVLARLEVILLAAVVTAVSGSGPTPALFQVILTAVLMLLAWPTEHKARLLLRRAGAVDR
jgi:multisubunit Na+/H+ antiporter MnhB subunit